MHDRQFSNTIHDGNTIDESDTMAVPDHGAAGWGGAFPRWGNVSTTIKMATGLFARPEVLQGFGAIPADRPCLPPMDEPLSDL